MITWAIVPVKPLVRAKSRLADVLTSQERENLSFKMLFRTIEVLKSCQAIDDVLVISRDTRVLAMVRTVDVHTVQESGQPELNDALTRATSLLQSWGVEATLVIPADIPLISEEDIEQIVHLGRYRGSVVASPDMAENGTNALFIHPPGLIEFAYGEGSFHRHVNATREVDAILHVYESDRIRLDVDTPEDLIQYSELAQRLGEDVIDYTQQLKEAEILENPILNGDHHG